MNEVFITRKGAKEQIAKRIIGASVFARETRQACFDAIDAAPAITIAQQLGLPCEAGTKVYATHWPSATAPNSLDTFDKPVKKQIQYYAIAKGNQVTVHFDDCSLPLHVFGSFVFLTSEAASMSIKASRLTEEMSKANKKLP